ncbi:uncharacterized protein [Miscanthus floridulus]|uniref:uncharacterized protein n=1 Tax=Miscanthus floridulus TaxID=154761 RepID=UPI0034590AD2
MEFWNSVKDCLRASAPLLIVLRVVDGDERPAMPEVAALMNHAKEKIKLSFVTENKKTLLKNIIKIIEKRWVTQMDHPLYGAALYLNLGRLHSLIQANDDATVGQLRGCFLDMLGRMVEDEEIRSKIDAQSLDYEGLRGDAFSNKIAKQNLQNLNPLDWWRSYGGRAIELQRFARRIVSLCASSSGCERNWSTFEFMHTKKRNRLLHKQLNDIVFVSYNRKMKTRIQLRRARECDNGDNGNGLTWELVDEAIGASSSLRGCNLLRNASSKRARNGQSRLAKLEEDLGLANEEEEEEDPHDDVDLAVWEKKREFRSSKGVVWHMEEGNWKQEDHCYMGSRIGSKKRLLSVKILDLSSVMVMAMQVDTGVNGADKVNLDDDSASYTLDRY